MFLGRLGDGRHVWAVRGPLESPEDPNVEGGSADLRRAGQLFDDVSAQLVSTAAALLNWHDSARFSAIDGAPTKPIRAGWARVNPATGHEEFPRIDPAIICLVHDGGDRAVLARQTVWPERMFSLLAGFVEAGESFETCVAREIDEEIGLTVSDVRYLGSQPWPFPRSLMVGFHAIADPGRAVRLQRRRDRRGGLVHPRRGSRGAGARRLEQRLGIAGCCCPARSRSRGRSSSPGRVRPELVSRSQLLASFALTSLTPGLVSVEPSANFSVGTTWLPLLTDPTNSAAAGSCSMSTSSYAMPSDFSAVFSRRQ